MMGLAGTPHCVLMCGSACGALTRPGTPGPPRARSAWHPTLALHLGRVVSYTVAGFLAAGSVGSLASLGAAHPVLRTLWTLVHAAALSLGLWLLATGQQPDWAFWRWRPVAASAPAHRGQMASPARVTWVPRGARPFVIGSAWAAWPCGLLHGALIVAALGRTPLSGGLIMATFALASCAGLVLGPMLWRRLLAARASGSSAPSMRALGGLQAPIRLAGGLLVASAVWALGHGVWDEALAWCLSRSPW